MAEASTGIEQVGRYRHWRAQAGVAGRAVWRYLGAAYDIDAAALFSTLFVPDFVEVRGCILLAERADAATIDAWWTELRGDAAAIERVVNHTHLYDLFPASGTEEVALAMYERVARALLRCWRCALAGDFPSSAFEFSYGTEPEEYGPTVTFWRVRHP